MTALTAAVRAQVEELVNCIDPVMTLHDFRMVPGPTHTNLIFDVAAPFGFRLSDQEIIRQICALVQSLDTPLQRRGPRGSHLQLTKRRPGNGPSFLLPEGI